VPSLATAAPPPPSPTAERLESWSEKVADGQPIVAAGKVEAPDLQAPISSPSSKVSNIVHTVQPCRELQLVSLLVPTHQYLPLDLPLLLIDFADLLVLVQIQEFL
jgi:hypothetical protein